MVIFFGMVALLLSTWLMLHLRHQRAFRGQLVWLKSSTTSYKIERKLQSHKGQATLQLGIFGSRGVDLRVQREDVFSGFLKALNVGRDVRCGNHRLDDELLFETDDPRVVLWLQTSPEAQSAISALFAAGAKRLMAFEGRCWVVLRGAKDDIDESDALSLRLAEPLQRLIMRIPDSLTGAHERSVFHAARALLLLALSAGLAITAALMLMAHGSARFPQHASSALYTLAFTVGIAIGAVLWWCVALWLKDSARARPVLFELAVVGLGAFVTIIMVGAGQANIALAHAPVVEEVVDAGFTKKSSWRRRGGSKRSYFIALPALQNGAIPRQSYRINRADYWAMQRTERVSVASRRGYFGYYFLTQMPRKVD